jgi:hypothetical protein
VRWSTRRHCHVDRAACAWLIRRFIDPEAEFVFVDDPDEVPPDATPFDMRGAELSHHGGDCTFETVLRRYELADPVLWEIAKLVHEADLADERYDAPEAAGLDVLLRGLSMVRDDDELLALSGPLFDGLYEYRKRALLLGREPVISWGSIAYGAALSAAAAEPSSRSSCVSGGPPFCSQQRWPRRLARSPGTRSCTTRAATASLSMRRSPPYLRAGRTQARACSRQRQRRSSSGSGRCAQRAADAWRSARSPAGSPRSLSTSTSTN